MGAMSAIAGDGRGDDPCTGVACRSWYVLSPCGAPGHLGASLFELRADDSDSPLNQLWSLRETLMIN